MQLLLAKVQLWLILFTIVFLYMYVDSYFIQYHSAKIFLEVKTLSKKCLGKMLCVLHNLSVWFYLINTKKHQVNKYFFTLFLYYNSSLIVTMVVLLLGHKLTHLPFIVETYCELVTFCYIENLLILLFAWSAVDLSILKQYHVCYVSNKKELFTLRSQSQFWYNFDSG